MQFICSDFFLVNKVVCDIAFVLLDVKKTDAYIRFLECWKTEKTLVI